MFELIMLGHRKQVGKDTLADMLVYSNGYARVAFADKLKEIVGDLYRLSPEQLNGKLKETIDKRYNLTPRTIMQSFGVYGREVYDKTWVDYVLYSTIPKYIALGKTKFVCTDLRFENEHQDTLIWAKENNFRVTALRVDRPSLPPLDLEDHISETALMHYDKWDGVIVNPWDGKSSGIQAMNTLYANYQEKKYLIDKSRLGTI